MKHSLQKDGYTLLPGTGALVTLEGDKDSAGKKATIKDPKDIISTDWSPWGDLNTFPQDVLEDLEKNSIALRALEKRKSVHYGRGIAPYKRVKNDDGTYGRELITEGEVHEFFRINKINLQWIDLIGALEVFANGWLEMVLNKDRSKINRVYHKDPAYSRWAKMNQTGRIPAMYYSANWPNPSKDEVKRIPTYDPDKYSGGKYDGTKFAYPVVYKSFNKSYYHLSVWNGVRKGGWISLANKIPELKLAIMKNQMSIKYHVKIPDTYFQRRYPEPQYTKEDREAKITEKMEELNTFLKDVENYGKSLVTLSYWNEQLNQEFPGWKIEVIDNKLKDDAYLPDSQAANSEILFAIGVDPSLIGASGVPGGKLSGAGSGSDKREAFWALNAEMGTYRQVSLDPLYFIRDFNGWGNDVEFDYIVVDTSQTQSEHPSKTEKRIDENAT